jgi:hypothetical protein
MLVGLLLQFNNSPTQEFSFSIDDQHDDINDINDNTFLNYSKSK